MYNNTAKTAGDDLLFNGATFTLPNAKEMSGDRILSSDKAEIIGWYHDGWFKRNAAANNGQGGYEQITEVNKAVAAWVQENGYEFDGLSFCIYHVSPYDTSDPGQYVTEVCYPVRKR